MNEHKLTITLMGRSEFITVDSFLSVVENTLEILKDIDASVSQKRQGTLEWKISHVSLNSPLTLTVFAESQDGPHIAREVVQAYTNGIRQLEESDKRVPPHFNVDSLEHAKNLVGVLNNGIERIALIDSSNAPIIPSQKLAAHVDQLAPKEYEELATFEGKLEMLSVHGSPTFNIYDILTGNRISCRFPRELLEEAHKAFNHRVSVFGKARYGKEGKPKYINVESLKLLREQSELPQARDLEGIYITGEQNPTEYIRSLRDAE